MYRQDFDMPRPRRSASAAAATLLAAALAFAGPAWSSQAPREESLDPARVGMPPDPHDAGAVVAARGGMAQWQPVAAARLDALRGGFNAGGLQVSFGIERAVYINGNLVVSTSLVIPDVSRITSEQAGRLAAALQTAANAGSIAAAALGGHGNANGAGAAATPGQAGSASAAAGTAGTVPAQQAGAPALPPAAVIATATGAVSTNGLLSVIQNGPGNSFNAGALAGTPATVIQNTLNNQSIQSLLTIDAGVNTLQAFRAGIAASALDSALQRAASMR